MDLKELKISQIVEDINNIKEQLIELKKEKKDLYIQLIAQYEKFKEIEKKL